MHVGDLHFDDLDLVLQVKLEIGPKYFVTSLAKSRHRSNVIGWLLPRIIAGRSSVMID